MMFKKINFKEKNSSRHDGMCSHDRIFSYLHSQEAEAIQAQVYNSKIVYITKVYRIK